MNSKAVPCYFLFISAWPAFVASAGHWSKPLTCRIGSPNGRSRLMSRGRSPDNNKIHRAARSFIVENPDHQPTGFPGQRIEVGTAFVKQRSIGEVVMTMDHVEFAEPVRKSVGIALAQQGRFALPLQGNFGIDAGMDVDALLVDIDQPQPIEPGDMSLRHVGWVATVGSQGSVTALLDPGSHFRSIPQCLDHHDIVVALERDQPPAGSDACQQPINHGLTVRTFIDVITYRDNDAGLAWRTRDYACKSIPQQIVASVNVRDDVGQAHRAAASGVLRRGCCIAAVRGLAQPDPAIIPCAEARSRCVFLASI